MDYIFTEGYADRCSTIGRAAREGDVRSLERLLAEGRPTDVRDNRGWEPLHEAAWSNHTECLNILLEKANVNVNVQSFAGETALYLAAKKGSTECVAALLDHGADPNIVTPEGYNPLWLDWGSMVDEAAFDGASPLLAAAQEGHDNCVELLLSYNANPNLFTLDSIPICALQSAIVCNRFRCVKLLYPVTDLQKIKEKCSSEWQPVCVALDLGTTDILRYLLTQDPARDMTVTYDNWRHQHFWEKAPLLSHATSEMTIFQTVETLLEYGFEVNDFRDGLMPPILAVLKSKRFDFLELFWRHGACPNVYHPQISGNCCVLFALANDLTSQDVMLPNFQGHFLQQVLQHGAEVRSCLLMGNQPIDDNYWRDLSSLFESHQVHERFFNTILCILMFLGGSFLKLDESLAVYISKDQTKLKRINDKNSSLLHLCRLRIIRLLQKNNKYNDNSIASLDLPLEAQEMLQLKDCGNYQYFLKKVFSPSRLALH